MKITADTKRHIISAALTFVTAFVVTIAPVIDTISAESFENGAFWALVLTGARAGIKALF